jgi:hypothetical protein
MTVPDDVRPGLLDDMALESSAVVANCAMNRERQLAGPNSYEKELGPHPVRWLVDRLEGGSPEVGSPEVGWLDLCCGSGGRSSRQRPCCVGGSRPDRRGPLADSI